MTTGRGIAIGLAFVGFGIASFGVSQCTIAEQRGVHEYRMACLKNDGEMTWNNTCMPPRR